MMNMLIRLTSRGLRGDIIRARFQGPRDEVIGDWELEEDWGLRVRGGLGRVTS